MKKIAFWLGLVSLAPALTLAQTNVGVSVFINQPGVYGRVDFGNLPPPRLVYPQPLVIVESPVAVYQRPVYLYVPPGHQKNWKNYCGRYNACGQPVYFVQEEWVRERYEKHHGHGNRNGNNGNGKSYAKGYEKGQDKGDKGHDKGDKGNKGKGGHKD